MAISPEQQTFSAAAATRLNTAFEARTGNAASFTAQQWTTVYRVLILDDAPTEGYTEKWLAYKRGVLARAESLHTMAQEAAAVGDDQAAVDALETARDSVAALVGMAYDANRGPSDPLFIKA
jgi:hypothetical protein